MKPKSRKRPKVVKGDWGGPVRVEYPAEIPLEKQGAGQRNTANPDVPDANELQGFQEEVAEFIRVHGRQGQDVLRRAMDTLRSPKNPAARRELVLGFVLAQAQTWKIKAAIKAAYPSVGSRTVDADISWAKKWHADHITEGRRELIKAEVDGIYQTLISRNLERLPAVAVRANDSRAKLHHLIAAGTGGGDGGDWADPETGEELRRELNDKLARAFGGPDKKG